MTNAELLEKLFEGNPRAVARAITKAENGADDAADLMKAIFPRTGNALIIGITGAPGAGKSSLVDKLAFYYKERGEKIGITPSLSRSCSNVLGNCLIVR